MIKGTRSPGVDIVEDEIIYEKERNNYSIGYSNFTNSLPELEFKRYHIDYFLITEEGDFITTEGGKKIILE